MFSNLGYSILASIHCIPTSEFIYPSIIITTHMHLFIFRKKYYNIIYIHIYMHANIYIYIHINEQKIV